MKKFLSYLLVAVLFGAGGYYIGNEGRYDIGNTPLIKELKKNSLTKEEKLKLLDMSYVEGKEMLKIPSKLDQFTTLENMEKDEESIAIIYSYTISNLPDEDIISKQEMILQQTMGVVCNTPQSRALLEAGVNMKWRYFNEAGDALFENNSSGGC